jgi:hypothetical protein
MSRSSPTKVAGKYSGMPGNIQVGFWIFAGAAVVLGIFVVPKNILGAEIFNWSAQ